MSFLHESTVRSMSEYESRTLQDMSLYTQQAAPDTPNGERFQEVFASAFPLTEGLSAAGLLRSPQVDTVAVFTDGLFIGNFAALPGEESVLLFFLALGENTASRGYAGRLLSGIRKEYPHQQIIIPVEKGSENDGYDGLLNSNQALFLRNGYRASGCLLTCLGREYRLLCSNGELRAEPLEKLLEKAGASFSLTLKNS